MSKQILQHQERTEAKPGYSLSLVLPVYNEEQVIAYTVSDVLAVVPTWTRDFEVIVVNDGSTDHTAVILETLCEHNQHLRVITHTVNQGYGAALVSGFAAATKELTFFMDSDGQFDILDLETFFPFLDSFDAVIGYRKDRQDTWMRKFNAWGWKQAVRFFLGIQVRDLDCAFKLLPTEFLHTHPLETRGAMINAEIVYTLRSAGCTYKEVGVRHLPRRGGRATGAKPAVIIRAFKELFVAARRWKRAQPTQTQMLSSPLHKNTR
jgi:glycosyltransferase involved in cell wall biosynthesis